LGSLFGSNMRIKFCDGVPTLSTQSVESDRCLDIAAQDGLSGFHIAGQHGFDALTKQRFAKLRFARYAGVDDRGEGNYPGGVQ